jgi:lipopolysaccharide export LptBFGC system permease protein LptF
MKTRLLKNNKGIALVISLVVTMFLLTFGSILLSRTFSQRNLIEREKRLNNSFYLAEAGAQAGLNRLDRLINTYLLNSISTTNPDTLSYKINQFVAQNKSVDFLVEFSMDNGVRQLEQSDESALHQGVVVELNKGQYQYKIRIRQKGTPTPIAAEIWDFPYYFTVESMGTVGDTTQWVSASGSFNVRIQRVSFSKAILFKNADFKNQTDEKAYVASSGDITKKITWQGGQL